MSEQKEQLQWLYVPNAKPAKELSKHDQRIIRLGWDAHRTLKLHSPAREKIEELQILLGYALLAFDREYITVDEMDLYRDFTTDSLVALIPDKKDGYSVSTIVDVENNAYKAGEKQGRNRVLDMMNKRDVGGVSPEWALDDKRFQNLRREV